MWIFKLAQVFIFGKAQKLLKYGTADQIALILAKLETPFADYEQMLHSSYEINLKFHKYTEVGKWMLEAAVFYCLLQTGIPHIYLIFVTIKTWLSYSLPYSVLAEFHH